MIDVSTTKKRWVLTQTAFDKLLARLDTDRERAGEKYEDLRSKLVTFFQWRGSTAPDEQADEVLNRLAQKIDQGTDIQQLQNYCYGIAQLVWLDCLKKLDKERAALEQLAGLTAPTQLENDDAELQDECFNQCLQKLSAANRELIIEYYREEERARSDERRSLAGRLGLPLNALRVRACRVRTKLEECVAACVERSEESKVK